MRALFVVPGPLRAAAPPHSAAWGRVRAQKRTYAVRAALRAQVLHLGRRSAKDAAYDAPVLTYITRMRASLRVEERWLRRDAAVAEARRLADREPVILLHETGRMPRNSVDFSELLYDRLQRGGSRVTFVIGDDDGIPPELSATTPNFESLSLSTLTLTHKMVRLFFIEQLYRATQIRANTKYHR